MRECQRWPAESAIVSVPHVREDAVTRRRSGPRYRPRSTRPVHKRRSAAVRSRATTKKSGSNNNIGCAVVSVGALAIVALSVLAQEVAQHPIASSVVGFLVVVAAGFAATRWVKLREQRRRDALAQAKEIARYHLMNFTEFERALAFLCERDGCTGVQVVGGAGDLGADVVAYVPDGRKVVFQAKRYSPGNPVTGPDLQKFGGTCFSVHRAQIAAVVTTSRFTKQACDYAAHMNIRLVDGNALAVWASETGPPPWL